MKKVFKIISDLIDASNKWHTERLNLYESRTMGEQRQANQRMNEAMSNRRRLEWQLRTIISKMKE